ncbi:MAG: aspartate/methionine/tyrosine aminotransferase [Candidatus Omnitrophota bacterium]|jgi:aspartate/methionine/tyrosine aminotransferase
MRTRISSPSFFIGKGDDSLISFGSGQPDLPPPKEIFEILPTYKAFKYGSIQGQDNLREAISKQYPGSTSNDFVITNGASEALDLVFRFIKRFWGKKILIPRPYYYSYPFNVEYAGLDLVYYDLNRGKINLDSLRPLLNDCSAILINSPSNPTGSIQDVEVLKEIESITQSKGIYIISDEVYKDLIYVRENYNFSGNHVITINSFSKTFAMCGFRIGYLYSSHKEVVQAAIDMKTHTSMNTNILGQEMAYAATQVPSDYLEEQVAIWKERRDLIYQGFLDLGLDLWKPEGAFYVFPYMGSDSNKVINELFYDHNIITYDGAWFGAPGRVRFSYALDITKIKEGLRRVGLYLKANPIQK